MEIGVFSIYVQSILPQKLGVGGWKTCYAFVLAYFLGVQLDLSSLPSGKLT